MNPHAIPPVPHELLTELERRFPDVMPEPDTTVDAIRIKQGQVSVIRFLRYAFNEQNKNVLET